MTHHTPGPWRLGKKTASKVDGFMLNGFPISASGQAIARVWAGTVGREGYGFPEENLIANAKLIAAAPILLAMLASVVFQADTSGDGTETYAEISRQLVEKCRAAIAKAGVK